MSSRARVIDRISPAKDHFLFIIIYLLGAISIIALRLSSDLHTLVVLIIPITLILAYILVVYTNEGYKLREDRAADNVYYLGFLFTVTTLGVALVRYEISSDPEVRQIIGDLGLGLITTVVGLLGRIFLGQLRQDPEEIEERARLSLARAVETSSASLANMNEQVARVHAHSTQVMRDAQDILKATNDGIVVTVRELEKRIDAIEIPEDIIVSKIQPLFDQLAVSIEETTNRMSAIRIDENIIDSKLDGLFEPLGNSINTMNETIKNVDSSMSALVAHSESIKDFAKAGEDLAGYQERLTSWLDEIVVNQSRLAAMNEGLRQSIEAISLMQPSLNNLRGDIANNQEQYANSIASVVATLAEAQERVEGMSEQINGLAVEFASAMQTLIESANSATRG